MAESSKTKGFNFCLAYFMTTERKSWLPPSKWPNLSPPNEKGEGGSVSVSLSDFLWRFCAHDFAWKIQWISVGHIKKPHPGFSRHSGFQELYSSEPTTYDVESPWISLLNRPFHNNRAWRSGNQLILFSCGTSCDGFWSSKIVKVSVG